MQVEIPGMMVIGKLRRGESLDELERKHLSYFLATMIRRVPHARKRAEEFIPQVLADVCAKTKERIRRAAANGELDEAAFASMMAEAEAVEKKYRIAPPEQVSDQIRTPWPFTSWLLAIHNMNWKVIRHKTPNLFLTNDNPAHYFEAFGLGHLECELILPLAGDALLHCSWQGLRDLEFMDVTQQMTKEFNRRIAIGADRCIFYHKKVDWVFEAARNRPEALNRIRWTD